MRWKLVLLAASALALLIALGARETLRGQGHAGTRVEGRLQELDAPAAVEGPPLEADLEAPSAQRRGVADAEPPAENEPGEPDMAADADGFSVRVSLRELDGAPLAPGGASVSLTDASGVTFGAHPNVDGVAVMTGLEPGAWWIRGSAPGRVTETRELQLPRSDAGLEVELRLAPRPHVRILVHTPDGRPFAATVAFGQTLPSATASRRRPEGWLGDALDSAKWLDCGSFRGRASDDTEPALLGRIELECEPPLWVSLHLSEDVLSTQLLGPGVEELRFVVDPDTYAARFAELVLRVIDADGGRPLQGAIGLLATGPWHSHFTSSKGETGLRYPKLMAGRARLELSASGYESRVLELVLEPGERKDLGDVELTRERAGTLEVHVDGGAGAADLVVTWAAEVVPQETERGVSLADTEPVVGEALEIELGPGRWVLWANATRDGVKLGSQRQLVEMTGGRVAVTLAVVPVATLVLEPVGRPIEVWVCTQDGSLAHPSKLFIDEVPCRVELVPGRYVLKLREKDGQEREQEVELPAPGATIRVD